MTEIRDVDRFFRDETIRALFSRTVDEMRRAYADEGRDAVFRVFERTTCSRRATTTVADLRRGRARAGAVARR